MPFLEQARTSIHYEVHGDGCPLLVIAGGGMDSRIDMWSLGPIDAIAEYADEFRVIAMDQRNAGQSVGPLEATAPWQSYIEDQLALLDSLGVYAFHVMGCCIGSSFALRMCEQAPGRVLSAVLVQPIGVVEGLNEHHYDAMWRSWGADLLRRRPELSQEALERFGTAMWHGEFVLSVEEAFVERCTTPLLVLPGVDEHHPTEIGREVARLAPLGEIHEPWRDTEERVREAAASVRQFLRRNTPVADCRASCTVGQR